MIRSNKNSDQLEESPSMDGWEKYSKLVLTKIDELSNDHKELQREFYELKSEIMKDFSKISTEIAMLKTKAAFWGATAGTIFSLILGAIIQAILGGRK